MRQLNLLGIILIMLLLTFTLFLYVTVRDAGKAPEAPVEVLQDLTPPKVNEAREYRRGGVNYVEVHQSFHDYIIVENKYVLHVANCKCKIKKNGK